MDKVWFVTMHTGYCGTDGHDIMVLPEEYTDEQVQEEAWLMAIQHAEGYGICPPDYENDEEDENTSEGIEGYAVPYVSKEHDKHRCGGGSFMDTYYFKKKKSSICRLV